MVLAAEQFTPVLNDNKTVSVSSGTDVVMTVLLSGKSTTPNYINVKDITTGEGTTVTLEYGPNTAAYSCDINKGLERDDFKDFERSLFLLQ